MWELSHNGKVLDFQQRQNFTCNHKQSVRKRP